MDSKYNPSEIEERIYSEWMEKKCFSAHEHSLKPPFSMVIPPPNVTGILHMGHALNNTIQDIIARYRRMSGYETLWIPGTDHAGIATQNVVERKLSQQNKTRHDLGREKFIDEVWLWKKQYHETIINQLKKLGISCSWEHERFTMDEGLSRAVQTVFIKLYNDGLVYRGKRIIHWCPRCRTALSDEEAEHREVNHFLWYFRYPYDDGSGYITVATTRPETMLGDTAVAVHPTDPRYASFQNKHFILPLVNRRIPLIFEESIDKEFGTGAVKITPAHDSNDFLISQKHGLKPILIMDESAHLTGPIPSKYRGLDRFKARVAIVADMEKDGYLEKIEPHRHAVGHCYRCSTLIEPYYSDQWFVRMKPLSIKALEAATSDQLTFFPPRYRKTYIEWMENIRDWCISRQIWWGHRIPAWHCTCGHIMVSVSSPQHCEKCCGTTVTQDPDVLDTWFSSWLWPFSTMGWPENTKVLQKFYPTNCLATAPEILFFWVARMIMAGLYCTNKLPFTHIILHGTVRDSSGKKMSKSLGNSIDPLEIIDKYGTDALRFSLMLLTAQGSDVYLSSDTFDVGRNFANKLWNATRFIMSQTTQLKTISDLPTTELFTLEDFWIVTSLQITIDDVKNALENYRFNEACHILYNFIWHDYCDWYIESKKLDFYNVEESDQKEKALIICIYTTGTILKLLHPFMPFITEHIWKNLYSSFTYPAIFDNPLLIAASFPKKNDTLLFQTHYEQFLILRNIITQIRIMRADNNIPPDKRGSVLIVPPDALTKEWIEKRSILINSLAKLHTTTVDCTATKPAFAAQSVVSGIQVYLEFEGLIDRNTERNRLSKEISHLRSLAHVCEKKLQNPAFTQNAPGNVVEKEKEKYQGIMINLEKFEKMLQALNSSR